MRSRPPAAHKLLYHAFSCYTTRHTLSHASRPQLTFLSNPSRRAQARLISTETKEWLKNEVKIGVKYSIVITATGFLFLIMVTGIQEEYRAQIYPTPDEWNWNTRLQTRAAKAREDSGDPLMKNWMRIGGTYEKVLEKLQDAKCEGLQILEQEDLTSMIPVENQGRLGFDISQNPEPWRRGYYDILMGLVRAAEQLDNHVRHKARDKFLAWPANSIISPSNPRPKPIPVGMPPPPAERDCVPAFLAPDIYYGQILTTKGFTEKQIVDAAIGYGLWLEYKNRPDQAQKIFKWALDMAKQNSNADIPLVDPVTGVINTDSGSPSENILSATTALATHYATNSNLSLALPIFISILRARKQLSEPPPTILSTLANDEKANDSLWDQAVVFMKKCFKPIKFPPPPSDGCIPPYRDTKERCEEAGIMLNIGEILYASKRSSSNREDGLAWTREAVDNAEAELRQKGISEDAKKTCKQCLSAGLQNWMVMVEKLAQEEKSNQKNKKSWLSFSNQGTEMGRWESEEQVIKDRLHRASDLLSIP
ncbi:hypothetical protein K3495_g931 [Podosphaera aphanis]|nr:hypothetical protein K3495_g931 [Podosphaera aphanis]